MTDLKGKGFTLIELMVAAVIVGVLAAVALPSYRNHLVRSARLAAQAELLELASLQEKIFLNSNNYAPSVTAAYNGTSAGGLGRTSGKSKDGRYDLVLIDQAGASMGTPSQTFVLMATPLTGSKQVGDGSIAVTESGRRTCTPHCGPGGATSW